MYWTLIFCNIITPQLLWIRSVRTSTLGLFAVAMVVNVGMWLERFVIVVTSLHRDFLPSSWGMYYPTIWDWMTFIGTIGMFLTLFFLFIRFLPMISIFEMRTMAPEAKVQRVGGRTDGRRAHAAAGDLRPDGRVRRPDVARRGRASGPTRPATARSTPSRRTRSRKRGRRSATTTGGCR